MKKIIIPFAVITAITFCACGNQVSQGESPDTIDTVVIEEENVAEAAEAAETMVATMAELAKAGNVEAIKSRIAAARQYLDELAAGGYPDAANTYAERLAVFARQYHERLNSLSDGEKSMADLFDELGSHPCEVVDSLVNPDR